MSPHNLLQFSTGSVGGIMSLVSLYGTFPTEVSPGSSISVLQFAALSLPEVTAIYRISMIAL